MLMCSIAGWHGRLVFAMTLYGFGSLAGRRVSRVDSTIALSVCLSVCL